MFKIVLRRPWRGPGPLQDRRWRRLPGASTRIGKPESVTLESLPPRLSPNPQTGPSMDPDRNPLPGVPNHRSLLPLAKEGDGRGRGGVRRRCRRRRRSPSLPPSLPPPPFPTQPYSRYLTPPFPLPSLPSAPASQRPSLPYPPSCRPPFSRKGLRPRVLF